MTAEEIALKMWTSDRKFNLGEVPNDVVFRLIVTAAELGIAEGIEQAKDGIMFSRSGFTMISAKGKQELIDRGRRQLAEERAKTISAKFLPNYKILSIEFPTVISGIGCPFCLSTRVDKNYAEMICKILGVECQIEETAKAVDIPKQSIGETGGEVRSGLTFSGQKTKDDNLPAADIPNKTMDSVRKLLNSDNIAAGEAEKEVSSESEREKPERNSDSSKVCACDENKGSGSGSAPEPTKDVSPGNPLPRSETSPVADILPKCRGCGRPIFRGETVTVGGTRHSECSDRPDKDNCPTCGEPWEDHEPQISETGAGCLCPKDMGLKTAPAAESSDLQSQLKIPKNSKLLGLTNKEIKERFNITVFHRHATLPGLDFVFGGDGPDYKLIPDEFVAFKGTRDDILKFTNVLLEDTVKKFQFTYGWDNGKLAMEKTSLTEEEEDLLRRMTEVAFWEMGERTRMGSGDDQAYVDGMIKHLEKDKNMEFLVRIVFLLCRQANPGDELIRSILAAKDEQISKLISDNLSFFERGTEWGAEGGKTWRHIHSLCSKCKEHNLV